MPMHVHELHPSVVHAPLVLLPAAAAVDVMAATSAGRVRRLALDAAGRRLWWAVVGSAAFAGVAGMAASQQVRLRDDRAHDAMWLHGMGNVGLLVGAIGLAVWRGTHRASVGSAMVGAGAAAASLYTAWLGGELVYTHGAGVKAAHGSGDSPPLLSAAAPWALVRDAARGLGWLASRATRLAMRRQPLASGAATRASDATPATATVTSSPFELRP